MYFSVDNKCNFKVNHIFVTIISVHAHGTEGVPMLLSYAIQF